MSLKIKNYKTKVIAVTLGLVAGVSAMSYLTYNPRSVSALYSDNGTNVSTPLYKSLSEISTMQEMTTNICKSSQLNESKQLEDVRDGKMYWVTKLADGNCWMTQNLDLDLSTNTALTPADSDVKQSWTPENSTMTGNINDGRWSTAQTAVQSWDPGNYVYTGAHLDYLSCGTDYGSFSDCDQSIWKLAENVGAYDSHYSLGNYYSWNAATAGTGGVMTAGIAASSICPKGWILPTVNHNEIANDYASLLAAENITSENFGYKIRQSPLYFVPSGDIYEGGGRWAGNAGSLWSSRARNDSTTNAYRFMFNKNGLYAVSGESLYNQTYRYLGNTVRCVADMDNFPADEEPKINNPQVTVVVNPAITLDLSNDNIMIEADANKVATENFTATVTSNHAYSLTIKATDGATTALSGNGADSIPALGDSDTLVIGENKWGIRTCLATDMDCDIPNNTARYKGLTTNAVEYFSSDTGAAGVEIPFQIGVTVSPTLTAGAYTTKMIVTAAAI